MKTYKNTYLDERNMNIITTWDDTNIGKNKLKINLIENHRNSILI